MESKLPIDKQGEKTSKAAKKKLEKDASKVDKTVRDKKNKVASAVAVSKAQAAQATKQGIAKF